MPAYFLTNTLSDVASTQILNSLSSQTTTRVVTLGNGGSTTINWITPEYYPNSTTSPSGSATFVIVHTVTNANIGLTAQLIRVNSSGVTQTSGTITARQVTAASNTFTVTYPSWTGASCSDRILLRLVYNNSSSMNNQSSTLGLDRVGTYLLTSLTHNGTGCSVLRKPSNVVTFK